MAEPALKHMTVAEFLGWQPEPDIHYELFDGRPRAMVPTARGHSIIQSKLSFHIWSALQGRRTCTVQTEAGVRIPDREDAWYQPDLSVSCRPHEPDEIAVPEPILLVEVLSPSTENTVRRGKLPDYRLIPSMQEILLIDPARLYAEVHRRHEGGLWVTELLRSGDAVLTLASVGLSLPLAKLYDRIALSEATA